MIKVFEGVLIFFMVVFGGLFVTDKITDAKTVTIRWMYGITGLLFVLANVIEIIK